MTFMHCKKRKLRTGYAPPAGPYKFLKISGRADLYSALPHYETAADLDHQGTYELWWSPATRLRTEIEHNWRDGFI
jgi:hypothetical protein